MPDDADRHDEIDNLEDALARIEELEAELAEVQTFADPSEWPKTLELDPPIPFGKKETVFELEIRQPRLGDLQGIPLGPQFWTFDHVVTVAGKLTRRPTAFIRKLPSEQAHVLTSIVRVFFMKCL